MAESSRNRRVERCTALAERFHTKDINKLAFQDESMFTLQVRTNRRNNVVYGKGRKHDVSPNRLNKPINKFSKSLMVSAIITCRGVTPPFFMEENEKVNQVSFQQHLEKDIIPALERLYPRKDFVYVQDRASSHRAKTVQAYLSKTLKSRFVTGAQWPPNSPDLNPLDFYFWNQVKDKVYHKRHCAPFQNLTELRQRITEVWDDCAHDLPTIRRAMKQFIPRVEAVVAKNGGSIKSLYK